VKRHIKRERMFQKKTIAKKNLHVIFRKQKISARDQRGAWGKDPSRRNKNHCHSRKVLVCGNIKS